MSLLDTLVSLRRDLHQHPELGLHLPRTQARVLAALSSLPVEVTVGRDISSVTGVLRGRHPGLRRQPVLLRADMDALPIQELSGVPYSATGAAMHACGHDLHTAMLVGAAHLLAEKADLLAGDVVLMFQPGEESGDGARLMIEQGVLEAAGQPLAAAYALHVTSSLLPAGVFAGRAGPLLGASASVRVDVKGVGGHGAAPHHARDPVVVAAEMITSLQTLVTRNWDVFDPVVITVGMFRAGEAGNVIPAEATFEATLRSFSDASHERLLSAVPRLLRGIASAHGLGVDVAVQDGYPVTRCDDGKTSLARSAVVDQFGATRWVDLPTPLSASEDFGRVLEQVPGAMLFLGATPPEADPATAAPNHSAHARFHDEVVLDGARLLSTLAMRELESEAS